MNKMSAESAPRNSDLTPDSFSEVSPTDPHVSLSNYDNNECAEEEAPGIQPNNISQSSLKHQSSNPRDVCANLVKQNAPSLLEECNDFSSDQVNSLFITPELSSCSPIEMPSCVEESNKSESVEMGNLEPEFVEVMVEMDTGTTEEFPENDTEHFVSGASATDPLANLPNYPNNELVGEETNVLQPNNISQYSHKHQLSHPSDVHPNLVKTNQSTPSEGCSNFRGGEINSLFITSQPPPCSPLELPLHVEIAIKKEPDEMEICEPQFEEIYIKMESGIGDDFSENDAEHEETSGYQTENVINQDQETLTCVESSSGELENPDKMPSVTSVTSSEDWQCTRGNPPSEGLDPTTSCLQRSPPVGNGGSAASVVTLENFSSSSPIETLSRSDDRQRTPTKGRRYKCLTCHAEYTCKAQIVKHLRLHSGERPIKGDVCQTTVSSSNLTQHKRTAEKPFKCDLCPAAYVRAFVLAKHKLSHTGERPFKCDLCPAAFTHPYLLARHKRSHTDEKPVKCDLCSAIFRKSHNLARHKLKHTGENPFKCDLCPAAFSCSSDLTKHKRRHTGEKLFTCGKCKTDFLRKADLVRHKRLHTGERPYKCDTCQAGFSEYGNLLTHLRTHTGEKPFKCDVCQAAFVKHASLSVHKLTHSGEMLFKCDLCSVAFASSSSLNKHKRWHAR